MFAGPNGSGKSILYQQLIKQNAFHEIPYINADEIKIKLNAGTEIIAPVPLHDITRYIMQTGFYKEGKVTSKDLLQLEMTDTSIFFAYKGKECGDYLPAALADALREFFIIQDLSFTFETVMSHPSKIDFMKRAKEKGYKVYLYYITTSDPEINRLRIDQRVREGGHSVPEKKIFDRYLRSLPLLKEALPVTDRAYLFDNSCETPELVAEVTNGTSVHFFNDDIPEWALSFLPNQEEI